VKNFFVFMMIAVMGLSFAACGRNETVAVAVVNDSIPVETIATEIGNIIVMGEYIGTVEPNQQVNVLPGIPGEVLSVYFGVGDIVEAGDILFTIDTTDIENNIATLEAQLAVQNATVNTAQTGVSLVEGSALQSQLLQASGGINQATAGINQAELAIQQAEQNVEQSQILFFQQKTAYDMAAQGLSDTTILFEAGVVARVAFEQAEAAYQNAAAALERAQSGYTMATIALSQAQQGLAQAQMGLEQALEGQRILAEDAPAENRQRALDGLAQAQAARNTILVNIEMARNRLDDASVRAPISGVIERRTVEPFGFASPQAPAFVISAQDSMMVSFRVPQNSFEYLSVGDEITLNTGTAEFTGAITEISTSVSAGGLLSIKANIPNPPANLLGGTLVRIFAEAQRAENVPIVPLGVVHYDRGVPYIFVEENGFARKVQIETGIFDALHMQILSGVNSNERIISTWSSRLSDGVEVEIRAGRDDS